MPEQTKPKPEPLHIVGLRVENFLGVKLVQIDPKQTGLVVIGGGNGAGKSSVIDSIFGALGGKPDQKVPIRKGADSAEIVLDLGPIRVTRRIKISGTSDLKVEQVTEFGTQLYQSPQKMLDSLISKVAFDPGEFLALKDKAQAEACRRAFQIDTSEIDGRYKEAFDERAFVKREITDVETRGRAIVVPVDTPAAPLDSQALVKQIADATEAQTAISRKEAEREAVKTAMAQVETRIVEHCSEIDRLNGLIAEQEATFAMLAAKHTTKTAELEEMPDPPLVDDLHAQLAQIETINQNVSRKAEKVRLGKAYDEKEARRAELDRILQECQSDREGMLLAAVESINIDGLDIREDGLYIGGIPFAQANTAARLRVATAIALRESPTLRVFKFTEGGQMDAHSFELLKALAVEHNAQIWVELVATREEVVEANANPGSALGARAREVSFLIEDGEVV